MLLVESSSLVRDIQFFGGNASWTLTADSAPTGTFNQQPKRPEVKPTNTTPLPIRFVTQPKAEFFGLVRGHAKCAIHTVPDCQFKATVAAPVALFGAVVQLVVRRTDKPVVQRFAV